MDGAKERGWSGGKLLMSKNIRGRETSWTGAGCISTRWNLNDGSGDSKGPGESVDDESVSRASSSVASANGLRKLKISQK